MIDFKDASQTSGYKYSNLTDDDLRTISEAEQKLSKNHNSNKVLIAYDNDNGAG